MKHEHSLEVKVSPELQEKVDQTCDHLQNKGNVYLFGLGLVIGAVGMRIFSRPMVTVVVQTSDIK